MRHCCCRSRQSSSTIGHRWRSTHWSARVSSLHRLRFPFEPEESPFRHHNLQVTFPCSPSRLVAAWLPLSRSSGCCPSLHGRCTLTHSTLRISPWCRALFQLLPLNPPGRSVYWPPIIQTGASGPLWHFRSELIHQFAKLLAFTEFLVPCAGRGVSAAPPFPLQPPPGSR